MSEKKTIVIEFDYDESQEGVAEVFGSTIDELAQIVEEIHSSDEVLITKSFMEKLEGRENAGGILMSLAANAVVSAIREAQATNILLKAIKRAGL